MNDNEKKFENFASNIKFDDTPDAAHRDKLEQKLLNKLKNQHQQRHSPLKIWEFIIKSNITKLAAAAVIIISILIGINQFGSSIDGANVTFADVVQPILYSRTATFKAIRTLKNEQVHTYETMFMAPASYRSTFPDGNGFMTFQHGKKWYKSMRLQLKQKVAWIREGRYDSDYNEMVNVEMSFFDIQRLIQEAQRDNVSVEFLGERKIDGQNAIGYLIHGSKEEMSVWANTETMLPIRIEGPMGEPGNILTLTDFAFDVDLDESLFSFEAPEDYTVYNIHADRDEPTEKDLIETFRLWIETLDGRFPTALNEDAAFNLFSSAYKDRMGLKIDKDNMPQKQLIEHFVETLYKFNRGLAFVYIVLNENDWHYAGKDVRFGDTDTAIFWYQPKESETWRVIYGDLTVEDIAPEDLPE